MNKIVLIFFIIFFVACHNAENSNPLSGNFAIGKREQHRRRLRHGQTKIEPNNIIIKGDSVIIPGNSPVYSKLKVQVTRSQEYLVQLTTTGVVKPLSGRLAQISIPFDGRIVKSFVKLGQKVTTGSSLFEVSSSEYLESLRMFMQARRERELAEKNFLRKKNLLDSGICSKKEFDEAKLQFDLADKEQEKTTAILKIFYITPDEADLEKPLIVRSPIKGEIVQNDITVGQYLESGSDPILTIADIDKIWVVARVKEKDLGAISLQDNVEVFTESRPNDPIKGLVNYIGEIMNEQTRSVEVYIECDNPDHLLKSGMFVTVLFFHKIPDTIIIPASSVLQDFNKTYLFVQESPGIYIKREVTVSSIPDKKLIVNSGLRSGSTIITEGGIYLR